MTSNAQKICPECGSSEQYIRWQPVDPGHIYPLLGLGGFFRFAKYNLIVCGNCGLMRSYAEEFARANLPKSDGWKKL